VVTNLTSLDLGDHQLWPDGDITVAPDKVIDFIYKLQGHLDQLTVTEVTPEIDSYNRLADHPLKLKSAVDSTLFPSGWSIPERYKTLDLDLYLINLVDRIERDDLYEKRIKRLYDEILSFRQFELDEILRLLIYVVETLIEAHVVWGVGRGSSCSSYLLYLIGLHDVDSVKYEIDLKDFLR
jgi:hypothetical protein